MSADRTEKLVITRTHTGVFVKATVIEDGMSVYYTVKTYETQITKGIEQARAGADRFMIEAQKTRVT